MQDQKQHWDEIHQKGGADYYLGNPTDFAIEVQKIIPAKSKILELGCGAGNDSLFFAEKGHTVLATDFSKVAIEKNNTRYNNENVHFQTLDISQPFPFDDHSFDVIYSRLSLHYFTDSVTKEIFQELHRVLKSNGYLCFVCKSVNDPLYGKGTQIEKDMFDDHGHIRHFFSEEYVKECLRDNYLYKILTTGEEKFYGSPSAFVKVIVQKK